MEPIHITADTQRITSRNEIRVTQHDSSVSFVIKIQQNGKDVPLPTDNVYALTSLRLDNVAVVSPNLGLVTGINEVTFHLGAKELEVQGLVRASVQIINPEGRLSTLSFNYSVVKDLSNAPPTENEKTLIEIVLNEGPSVIEEAKRSSERAEQAAISIDQSIVAAAEVVQAGTALFGEVETLKGSTEKVKQETELVKSETLTVKQTAEKTIEDTLATKLATEQVKRETEVVKQATENLRAGMQGELTTVKTQLADKASKEEINNLTQQIVPKRYVFGKQLERLKYALANPLEQYVSIVFIGDSITWGMTVTGNPPITPRNGTLSDVRDLSTTNTFVNIFKRYVGSKYAFNASPIVSNWNGSPSGESIVEYTKEDVLFPFGGDFIVTHTGTPSSPPKELSSGRSLSRMQLSFTAYKNSNSNMIVEFNFTGKELTLSFDSLTTSMDYELFVDDVSQGVFTTAFNVDGNTKEYDNRRKHSFNYIRNKSIKIVTRFTALDALQTMRISGIIINKKIRISNQGIVGTSARLYTEKNLEGNTNGFGTAVEPDDRYIFVQLGTNDRLITSGFAKGSNEFKKRLATLIDLINIDREIIMMNANAATNEVTTSYSFTMQDVRNTVYAIAKEKQLDVIDNYSIFGNIPITKYTSDGLHPNELGHDAIARNIINSVEFN